MKPLIGITTAEHPSTTSWGAPVCSQNRQYPDAILDAGGVPVLLPFTRTAAELRELYDHLDGIVFAGGGDVDPSLYGEAPGPVLKDVSTERDRIELQLIKWAIADNKPILGICRGLQVMNVALGGTLMQDIPAASSRYENHDISTEKQNRQYMAHELHIEAASRLGNIVETGGIKTNSHHHQAIDRLANGLLATSRATDGIIESVELADNRFAVAVQSHPESLYRTDSGWAKLFAAFVAEARKPYSLDSALKSSSTEASLALETV